MQTTPDAQPAPPSPLALTAEALLDALPWGLLVLDAQRVIRRVNPQAARWCGAPPERLLGQPLAEAALPPAVRTTLLHVLALGEAPSREVWLPHTQQWVSLRTAPAPEAHRCIFWEDVTARQQAQQELHHSRQLLRRTIDSSPDLVQVFEAVRDERGEVVDFAWVLNNAAAEQVYGDVIGQRLCQRNPGVVEEGIFDTFRRVLETGVPDQTERRYAHEQFNGWFYQSVVKQDDGVTTTTRDITARKLAEQELLRLKDELAQQATDKYQALFEGMDQGFCLLELLFDEAGEQAVDFRYLEVNPVFARESGLTTDVPGRRVREVAPNLEPFWFETYGAVARTGEPRRVERYAPEVGRWFDLHAFRVGPPEARQVGVLFNDTTARKQAEERLRHAAEAETFRLQLADALGPLAGAVAIQEAVTYLARRHFGADRCYYCEIEEGLAVIRCDAAAEGLPSVAGTYPLADFALLQAVIEAGRPFQVRDVRQALGVDDNLRQLCVQLQVISYLDVPVMKNGQPAGVLCLVQSQPRDWTEAEAALAAEVAERTWAAVERARAEEALRESEAQIRAVANLVPDLLWRSTPDSNTTWYNQRWYEYTGQTLKDAAGYGWTEVIHPEDRAESGRRYRAAIADGQPLHQEHRIRSAQGDYRWFQVQARPVHNARGEVSAWFGAATDIHARKQAELALAASEQRLRTLIANLPGAAVFIVNRKLRYELAEGEALRQAGYEPADFRGRTVRELASPGQWPTYRKLYRKALAGRSFEYEHEQNGRTFASRGVPLPGPGGAVEAVLAVSYDITERQQAEEALRAGEQRLRLATAAANLYAWEIDLTTGALTFSDNAAQVAGRPLPGSIEENLRRVHPADRDRARQVFVAAEGTDGHFDCELRLLGPDADAGRWHRITGVLLRPDGAARPTRALGISQDITARKQAEAALADYNQRLEAEVGARTAALQTSQAQLQAVFDSAVSLLLVVEPVRDATGQVRDFRFLLQNARVQEFLHPRQLTGELQSVFFPHWQATKAFELQCHTADTGEPGELEIFFGQDELPPRWYLIRTARITQAQLLITAEDITERKTAEQERLKNLRLLKQAEAVASLGSWDYSLLTREFSWSDGMYQLFGLPLGQPAGPDLYLRFVVDEDRPRAEQLVHRLTTGGDNFEETLRLQVGAQVKTMRIKTAVLRDEAGQPVRVLGVDLDISELQRLEADNLHLRLTQQRALFEAVQQAQEAERKRMAESLHNGIGQILYATKLRLDQFQPATLLRTDPALARARREADQLLGEAIRQTRSLSHELVPMVLEEFGLAAALQDIGSKMSNPQLRLRSSVAFDENAAPLSLALQLALYRIAQELALNIVRHARGATEASLELETMPGWVLLRAEDNGAGFATPPAESAGLGLRSIRDQVALLGGRLETGTAAGGGAYVRIRLPLPSAP